MGGVIHPIHFFLMSRYTNEWIVPNDGDGCTHINLNILFGARTRRHHSVQTFAIVQTFYAKLLLERTL